jgi:hypothetical protein
MKSPDERLRERLAHLPDACRALLAALDRESARGGGEVELRLVVSGSGEIVRAVLLHAFEPHRTPVDRGV